MATETLAQDISIFDGSQWKSLKKGKVFDGSQWKDFKGVASDNATFHTIKNDIIKDIYIQTNRYPTVGEWWMASRGQVTVNNPFLFGNERTPPDYSTSVAGFGNAAYWPSGSFIYFTAGKGQYGDLLKDYVVCMPFVVLNEAFSQLCSIWTEYYLDFQFFSESNAGSFNLSVGRYKSDGNNDIEVVHEVAIQKNSVNALWLYLEKRDGSMGGELSIAVQTGVTSETSLKNFYQRFINREASAGIFTIESDFCANTALILGNVPAILGEGLDNYQYADSWRGGVNPLNVYFFNAENLW